MLNSARQSAGSKIKAFESKGHGPLNQKKGLPREKRLRKYKEQAATDKTSVSTDIKFIRLLGFLNLININTSAIHATAKIVADDMREESATEDKKTANAANGTELTCSPLNDTRSARQSMVAISSVDTIESGLEATPISISSGVSKKASEASRHQ